MITTRGDQQANYDFQHFSKLPVKPVKDDKGNFHHHFDYFARKTLCMRAYGNYMWAV